MGGPALEAQGENAKSIFRPNGPIRSAHDSRRARDKPRQIRRKK